MVAIPSNRGCCPTTTVVVSIYFEDGVAIPSNRGCCPTVATSDAMEVAIPSNRGCCPTARRAQNRGLGRRNPLKSGLLSYQLRTRAPPGRPRRRNPLKSGLLSYLPMVLSLCFENGMVAIPSNRGCCPTPKCGQMWWW